MGHHSQQEKKDSPDSVEPEHETECKAMHKPFYGRKAGNKGGADDSDRAKEQESEVFQIFQDAGGKQSTGISTVLIDILKKII